MNRKSALSGVFHAKCPRCREGDLFTHGMFHLKKMSSMHANCRECNLRYEKEPGYFYGAMYVSYALSTGIFLVSAFVLYHFFNDPPLNTYLITVTIASVVLYPLNFRYSRVLFIHVFGGIKYRPNNKIDVK